MYLSESVTRSLRRACGATVLLLVLNVVSSGQALAQACSDYGGVLDGFAGDVAPSQLQIDQNCTIRNYPASNPLGTNFSFFTQPGQNDERWLIVFDNVVHDGQMSCNSVLEHKIWFTNGSSSRIKSNCQNLLIPVEKIDKANPAGPSIATVGVPFTYTLTSPVLFDPATNAVIKTDGSLDDLHTVVLTDDLNATGVDLTYVSHTAYWRDSGAPVPHNFSNVGGVLTFDGFPVIPAGEQVIIELTVVLDDTANNADGTQFINTAKWQFGRLIEGVFYEPLPGEWGISPPLTISGPDLILSKSGPDFLNLGEIGTFTLDVRNIGGAEAWNVTIDDELPLLNGATSGGMCDIAPVIQSAQVFAADGVTPVPGKGPLAVGTDIALTWNGAPQCDLSLAVLTAAGTIGAGERLIITYQSALDADTDNGAVLTNVAGATEWFNGAPSIPDRQQFVRTLTDGTPGTLNLDHQDAHTVVAALVGSYFNKTVANVTTGQNPATTAAPGDTLRYSLQLRTTDSPLDVIQIVDDLGALNAVPVFEPGTLVWDPATLPGGADTSNTDPNGGTNGTGLLDIRNLSLPADSEYLLEFEIQLASVLPNGIYATNQATLTAAGGVTAYSDDPGVNGQANPEVDGDEDPTQVQIVSVPDFQIEKTSTYLDGDPSRLGAGERLRYTITVANTGTADAIDAVIGDQIPADTTYIAGSTTLNGAAVADLPNGSSPMTSPGGMPINAASAATPGLIPADAAAAPGNVATITFDVLVDPNALDGTIISNQAFVSAPGGGVSDQPSDDPRTPVPDDPTRDVVGNMPLLYAEKSAALLNDQGAPGIVDAGDTLRYTITVYNNSTTAATQALLSDAVPTNTTYVADSMTLNGVATGPDAGISALIAGLPISSSDLTPPLPGALDGTLTQGQSAVVQFDVLIDAGVPAGTLIVNQATVTTYEVAPLLTDGDGNPATGPEPTVVVVGGVPVSGPFFDVDKTSAYLDGDPSRLGAGERIRYTITVANIGSYAATDAVIVDQIPVNTTYVAGSTTLNGAAVADLPSGDSPLTDPVGMALNAPSDPTPGLMPADATAAPENVATITFDVLVDPNAVNGTVISNQAFVSAPAGNVTDQPSDDPRTPAPDDPTRDVVGNVPLLYAEKSAALLNDQGAPGIVDSGDTLRYTITVYNNSATAATQALLTDAVPTNTTYVSDSTTINGEPVAGDGGVSPLIAGLAISSSDLTPPLPVAPNGTLTQGQSAVIQFDVLVDPGLPAGTLIVNQATVTTYEVAPLLTDGDGNPATGPEPTVVVVGGVPVSGPYFDVDKISSYLDGDPARLLAGERIRYTITIANVGTYAATDAVIVDQIPVNTTYVAGSTTLNGALVPDLASGFSPLTAPGGMPVNAPSDPTPGLMPADATAAPENVATITFDVLVDPDVVDGTIIANQAFVSAPEGGVSERPSDDPRTEVVDDPTRDIVGNMPLLYAEKSAALLMDQGSPGVVDPGDTLRYTITVYNNSSIAATQALLSDAVPTNTTYVADSTTLNGESTGTDAGVSPLIAGLPISSSDLTPPLPGDMQGTLTPGQSAVIQFDVLVDAAVPAGTLIVNQATVTTYEVPTLLTDGDGNPATGPEPTVVVVGPRQLLSITKQVAVVGGGPAYAGSTLEYTVRVLNTAQVPAQYVRIYDDLDVPVPGYLAYVTDSATMNGAPDGIVFAGSLLTADYAAEYGALPSGGEIVLRFQAVLNANLQTGMVVTNTADVQWNDPPETASASVSVTIGGIPGAGILSGSAWHDTDFDDVFDSDESALEGWFVDLYQAGVLLHTAETDDAGFYRISGVAPSVAAADRYELVFRAPDAGPDSASLGTTFSDFTNGPQRISEIAVEPGSNLPDLHLPIDPNGVVYNALARVPLAGATLTMVDAISGTPLPEDCFDDPAQQDQVTRSDGFYKFDINFSDIACPEGADYLINVSPPPSGFWIPGTSQVNPPSSDSGTAPLSLPSCLQGGVADAIPATTLYCEATSSALTPPASAASRTPATAYYLHLTLDNSSNPGSRQIFNNHIPLDPDLRDAVSITKTTPLLTVRRGDLVPYILTVSNDVGFDISEISVVDRFPAGFRYIEGSARLDGEPNEPLVVGNELYWSNLALSGSGTHRIELLLAVGSGVSEGEFVNRAQVVQAFTGNALSSEAQATVRLVPDVDFDCTDVMGKVFNDANRNGLQDNGEDGIPGVRLVTANGLAVSTDAYGRYHITCATVPNETRGSNFVVKLDDRTLPSGFRSSRSSVQIARATRGKALRFNFGASIHRVIGIDLSDPIFDVGETTIRPQWQGRIDLLMDQLQAAPAVLRISYLADLEEPRLVEDRLDAFEDEIRARWRDTGNYELEIEPEVFWRRGRSADRPSDSRESER